MARTGTLLEAVTSYYSTLAFNSLATMRRMQEDLRTNNFTVGKAVGAAVQLCLDASDGWWNALLVTASPPVPTVLLRTGPEGGCDAQTVDVSVPGNRDPECTELGRIGGTERIGLDYIVIETATQRNAINIKLRKLKELSQKLRKPLAPGLYQGLVHIDERPLAIVLLRVDD